MRGAQGSRMKCKVSRLGDWDEKQSILDPKDHKALTTWPEKIGAALTACSCSGTVDKNGALIGSLSPEARKLLHASKGQGRDSPE